MIILTADHQHWQKDKCESSTEEPFLLMQQLTVTFPLWLFHQGVTPKKVSSGKYQLASLWRLLSGWHFWDGFPSIQGQVLSPHAIFLRQVNM